MTYEAWRCTFQSAEQAALAAYSKVEELTQRVAELEAERAEREAGKLLAYTSDHPARPLELVGLRGCNSLHGGAREPDPCVYRYLMRTTDTGCTGCADRDEDQAAEAGG